MKIGFEKLDKIIDINILPYNIFYILVKSKIQSIHPLIVEALLL